MNFRSVECAFGDFGKKSVLAQQFKQLPQMVFMLLGVFRADNDIVHICHSKVFDRGRTLFMSPWKVAEAFAKPNGSTLNS